MIDFKIEHEIKNSLCVCKNILKLMDNSKYKNLINNEIERSIELIQNNLKNKTYFNLIELFKNMKLLFGEIKLDILDNNISLYGDSNRLKQAFINIIQNSIEAKSTIITIKLRIYKQIVITIKDNGQGINYINKNSHGIGLKISEDIIKDHFGSLDYTFDQNGALFIIKLNLL